MRKNLLLLLMLACSFSTFAQRTCDSDAHMEQLMSNPDYVKNQKKRKAKFKAIHSQSDNELRSAVCANPVVLPMAVHFQGITNPDINCLTNLAIDQIRVLNEDYQGTNADISNWNNNAAAAFPGVSNGESCIEFCLATQNHPAGFGLANGDFAITFNQFSSDNNAAWAGYINIFVRNINALGYSPLGGSGNGDGVTIDDQAFGLRALGCGSVTANNPYTLGRTLTHELGHYLNLDHIWGGGCNRDDGVADTPNAQGDYGGCPAIGANSCGSTDMHMNYMDYTNDPCMYMFSAGQSTIMENYVAANMQGVANNAASVCGQPATCSDGIQNQNETGVDCGGVCTVCPCNGTRVTLTLVFDTYPQETGWTITDAASNVVASGTDYGTFTNGSSTSIPICLPDGCYDFSMTDTYGDGICCQFGNGSYTLVNDADGAILASGGNFTTSETTNICVPAVTCQPFLNLSNTETTATLTEQAINYITSNSTTTGSSFVTYHAGNYLDLTSGFNVTAGANFHGYILACSAATLRESVPETQINSDLNENELRLDFETNPGVESGVVNLNLPTDSKISVSVMSTDGREIYSKEKQTILNAGLHQFPLKEITNKEGIYFFKVTTDNDEKVIKVFLEKE